MNMLKWKIEKYVKIDWAKKKSARKNNIINN